MAKSKYETHVVSKFEDIEEWCKLGAQDKEIIDNLNISPSAFYEYKNKYSEFADVIRNARKKPVYSIRGALLKRATGFYYTETEWRFDKRGNEVPYRKYEKYVPPDINACKILLMHWDSFIEWTDDPLKLELKRKELELKVKMAEEWE